MTKFVLCNLSPQEKKSLGLVQPGKWKENEESTKSINISISLLKYLLEKL